MCMCMRVYTLCVCVCLCVYHVYTYIHKHTQLHTHTHTHTSHLEALSHGDGAILGSIPVGKLSLFSRVKLVALRAKKSEEQGKRSGKRENERERAFVCVCVRMGKTKGFIKPLALGLSLERVFGVGDSRGGA